MPSELYNKLLSCHWNKIVMLSFAVDSGFFEGVKRVLHVGEVKCRFFDSNIYLIVMTKSSRRGRILQTATKDMESKRCQNKVTKLVQMR